MTTNCKAKNPATCRYHGALSAETLHIQRTTVHNMYTNVLETYQRVSHLKPELAPRYLNAFFEVAKIKEDADLYYYGTDEGAAELEKAKEETEDLNEILKLETLQKLAKEKRNLIESNPNINPVLIPSHEKIFTFPETHVVTNKLSQPVEKTGNKYNPLHALPRVREMVKTDVKKAVQFGFLPENLNCKVTTTPKSNVIVITADTTDKETLRKIHKIASAYNHTTINPDTGEENSSYLLQLRTPIAR